MAKKDMIALIKDDVWLVAQDLIAYAGQLEEHNKPKAAEGLREIVGQIENWTHTV